MQRKRRAFIEVVLGAGAGVYSGMFGVGGGFLLIPALTLLLRMPRKHAQATSLVAVGLMSTAGAVTFASAGNVAWTAAGLLILGGILGGRLGIHVLHRLSERALAIAFGTLLILTAITLAAPKDANCIRCTLPRSDSWW